MEPWGRPTPEVTFPHDDCLPLTETACWRPDRKASIHRRVDPLIPYKSSLADRCRFETLSNALSNWMTSTCTHCSEVVAQSWTDVKKLSYCRETLLNLTVGSPCLRVVPALSSFVHLFTHSFVRSFVRSFIRSFVHSLIHSFISFIHLYFHKKTSQQE